MPITVDKNGGATILTIRNFTNYTIDGDYPSDLIGDIGGTESDAMLIKFEGAKMRIAFDWELINEDTSVVSGAGSPVTTPQQQMKYLFDTLAPVGIAGITDSYTITIDFGGGVTMVRTGTILKLLCTENADRPLTYSGHMEVLVGTVF